MYRRTVAIVASAAGSAVLTSYASAQLVGPSTLQTPYVIPSVSGVQTISIASNGNGTGGLADEIYPKLGGGNYRLVGIPDGLGAFDNRDGSFTLLVNHELGSTQGIPRAHGAAGAFVSKWVINSSTLAVIGGDDLIKTVAPVVGGNAPFGRFCSADLPTQTAFFNPGSGLGTVERLFMNGEEVGNEGRAFATIVSSGEAHFLPYLGKFSWENSVANPFPQDKTLVVGTDDSSPGQVYLYVGDKTSSANPIDAAGLNYGKLYGLKTPIFNETTATPAVGAASFVDLSAFATGTGATLDTESNNAGVTRFARPEDGTWDPARPTDFYWVNTGNSSAPSRLYRFRLNDVTNPAAGGVVDLLLDGTEGHLALDNLCLVNSPDGKTRLLIQEDPGNNARLAKIWLYTVEDDSLLEIAAHDPKYFSTGGAQFVTLDEESTGIIPAWDLLGTGWFLSATQAHYNIAGELVQGGQLMAIYVPQTIPEPSALGLLGLAGLTLRRRRG